MAVDGEGIGGERKGAGRGWFLALLMLWLRCNEERRGEGLL